MGHAEWRCRRKVDSVNKATRFGLFGLCLTLVGLLLGGLTSALEATAHIWWGLAMIGGWLVVLSVVALVGSLITLAVGVLDRRGARAH